MRTLLLASCLVITACTGTIEARDAGGIVPVDQPPSGCAMEQLLVAGHDILVLQDPPREATDQGALFITHPALLAKYGPKRRIDMPSRYALCGGPALVQGLDFLRAAITSLR